MHEINFLYQKYNSPHNKDMILEIKELTISGLDYTDYQCKNCTRGFSTEGSDRCSVCPRDHFLNLISVRNWG